MEFVTLCSKKVSYLLSRFPACYFWNMKFENDKGEQVEINFQNFESVLRGDKPGLTRVKLKNGREEWLKATKDEILEAAVEE